jgi:anti-sigma factor RsiW
MFDPHLTASQVAAYLDGLVGPDERLRIELHLGTCDRCLKEVVDGVRRTRFAGEAEP